MNTLKHLGVGFLVLVWVVVSSAVIGMYYNERHKTSIAYSEGVTACEMRIPYTRNPYLTKDPDCASSWYHGYRDTLERRIKVLEQEVLSNIRQQQKGLE